MCTTNIKDASVVEADFRQALSFKIKFIFEYSDRDYKNKDVNI